MNKHYLGMVNDNEISIASNSVNQHLLIIGISGSGKSVRLTEIEKQCNLA